MRLKGKVRELVRRIETVPCTGLCWPYCGVVTGVRVEMERIRSFCEEHGLPFHDLIATVNERNARVALALDANDPVSMMVRGIGICPYLTEDMRCSIYPVRPLICRLFGAVHGLECPSGCAPDGGVLTSEETELVVAHFKQAGMWKMREMGLGPATLQLLTRSMR